MFQLFSSSSFSKEVPTWLTHVQYFCILHSPPRASRFLTLSSISNRLYEYARIGCHCPNYCLKSLERSNLWHRKKRQALLFGETISRKISVCLHDRMSKLSPLHTSSNGITCSRTGSLFKYNLQ